MNRTSTGIVAGAGAGIPFNPEHYFCWHKYYAYNSGIIGNLLPHRFLRCCWPPAIRVSAPRRGPGTRKVSTDREITDTTHLLAEFPNGLTLAVVGTTVNNRACRRAARAQGRPAFRVQSEQS